MPSLSNCAQQVFSATACSDTLEYHNEGSGSGYCACGLLGSLNENCNETSTRYHNFGAVYTVQLASTPPTLPPPASPPLPPAMPPPVPVVVYNEADLRAAITIAYVRIDIRNDINVTDTLSIPSDSRVSISSSTGASISGGSSYQIMSVGHRAQLTLQDLILKDGYTSGNGGAISLSYAGMNTTNCRFEGNAANYGGAVLCNTWGGGCQNGAGEPCQDNVCAFTRCSFANNQGSEGNSVRLYNGAARFEDCHFAWSNPQDEVAGPNVGCCTPFICSGTSSNGFVNCEAFPPSPPPPPASPL